MHYYGSIIKFVDKKYTLFKEMVFNNKDKIKPQNYVYSRKKEMSQTLNRMKEHTELKQTR